MLGINIISVIVLLGILIFVHELGHFLVAKISGVGVLKFSLGFGPKLVGKKKGETEYLLSAVPLGGYVKLLGESGDEELSPADQLRSFLNQSVYKRMGIVLAGPVFNFLFAFLLFAVVYSVGVPVLTARVGDVMENSVASAAGIVKGDMILAIDGTEISRWSDISDLIQKNGGRETAFTIEREGRVFDVPIRPRMVKGENLFGEEVEAYRIGIGASDETFMEKKNPLRALWAGLEQTWSWTKLVCLGIVKMIEGVVSPRELGGPILIAQMAGTQAKQGIIPFIYFMAVLSVNLGVLNLLPIPVLDGGHLLFYLIEAVTGREVNMKWREVAQQIGFFLIIMLMLLVFYNDIMRMFYP